MGGQLVIETDRKALVEAAIATHFEESVATKKRVLESQLEVIGNLATLLVDTLRSGGKILFCGNGGSAADSQHLAAELIGRFRRERASLPAMALTTDTSILTSLANDYSYDYVFARQVEAFGNPGDVLIGISTSGNSPNVLRAMETARALGLKTVGLGGDGGGKLAGVTDLCLCVPSRETSHIQEVHITVGHIVCEWIERELFEKHGDQ
jgi:D-sedoheptulose 7-phosphate isomerase